MFGHSARIPELMPQLSRGKHRNPRQGACFMEMVSYLGGEPWSDRPACTHPLLASLARLVNDHTSDIGLRRLLDLVPSVVGLASDDPRTDIRIMLRSATTALPVVSEERQRVLAVAVLAGERTLDHLDGRAPGELGAPSRFALGQVPGAERWARGFSREMGTATARQGVLRYSAPATVRQAVLGIADACVPSPDALLFELLEGAIADCAAPVAPRYPVATR